MNAGLPPGQEFQLPTREAELASPAAPFGDEPGDRPAAAGEDDLLAVCSTRSRISERRVLASATL
jgi:hypothetical protein